MLLRMHQIFNDSFGLDPLEQAAFKEQNGQYITGPASRGEGGIISPWHFRQWLL